MAKKKRKATKAQLAALAKGRAKLAAKRRGKKKATKRKATKRKGTKRVASKKAAARKAPVARKRGRKGKRKVSAKQLAALQRGRAIRAATLGKPQVLTGVTRALPVAPLTAAQAAKLYAKASKSLDKKLKGAVAKKGRRKGRRLPQPKRRDDMKIVRAPARNNPAAKQALKAAWATIARLAPKRKKVNKRPKSAYMPGLEASCIKLSGAM